MSLSYLRLGLAALLLGGCAAQFSAERGEELALAGRWDEAVQFYTNAIKREPNNAEFRLALARAMQEASESWLREGIDQEKAGNVDAAIAAYRRALGYNSEQRLASEGLDRIARAKQIEERLARARERMGMREWRAAQVEVTAALRLDPANAQAQALRQQINEYLSTEGPRRPEGERAVLQLFSAKPVTLRFRDTDIKEVLEVFAQTSGVNILTDESLQPKRITAFFRDLPLRDAFNMILTSNRFFAKRSADNTIIVIPDNPGKRQQYDELMVQTFYLTDADAKVVVNLLRTILNTRQIFVNEKLNALVVRETPEKVDLARKLLDANDRGVGEVEIDLEVLEVDKNWEQNIGLQITPQSYSMALTTPANLPITNIWPALKFGTTVNLTNPSLILNLVKTSGTTRTLANPTVRILDRQKARLLIGQRRPFQISSLTSVPAVAGTTATGTTAGTLPTGAVTTTQTNVEFRDVGLKLTLTPTVHLNNEVTVELSFEISSVGAPIAGVQGGQLLPPINTRNLDTFIKVRNGETRLLGGLFQEDYSVSDSPVPGLGDIPILGRIFHSPDKTLTRTDVLISITPHIVKALARPEPEVEGFMSGTAESFGSAAPGGAGAVSAPPPVVPSPARPSGTTGAVPAPGQTAPPAGAPPAPVPSPRP